MNSIATTSIETATFPYPESWSVALKDAKAKLVPKEYNQLQLLFAAAAGDTDQIDQSIKAGASLTASSWSIGHYSVSPNTQEPVISPQLVPNGNFIKDSNALDIACQHGNENSLMRILAHAKSRKITHALINRKSPRNPLQWATSGKTRYKFGQMSVKGLQALLNAGANWQEKETGFGGPFFEALSFFEKAYNQVHIEKALIILRMASEPYFTELTSRIKTTLPTMPLDLVNLCVEYCPPFCPSFLNNFPQNKSNNPAVQHRPHIEVYPLSAAVHTMTKEARAGTLEYAQEGDDTSSINMVRILLEAGANPHFMVFTGRWRSARNSETQTTLDFARSLHETIPQQMLDDINAAGSPEAVKEKEALAASIEKASAETAYRKTYRYAIVNLFKDIYDHITEHQG